MNIIETIKLHEKDFSKSERKVYEYIINHPETIETNTITKIADQCQTSSSAVLRFCQVLGFNGYKDFRFEMIKYLHEHHEILDSFDYFGQLTDNYVKTINQFKNLDRQMIDQLINILKNHQALYLFGIHYSSLPAKELQMGLLDLQIISQGAFDYMQAAHLCNIINENDAIIYFSINGSNTNFNRFIKPQLAKMPNNSYLITLNPNSKLANTFNHTIVLPGYSLTNQSVIDSQAIFTIFVELLLNTLHSI